MAGLINFRDFGGHPTSTGQRVHRDRLYRGGHLAKVDDTELAHVMGLDFSVIADLRYLGERESEPSPWPDHYMDRILAHDGDRTAEAPHMALVRTGALSPTTVERFYTELYRELPFDRLYRPLFASAIRRIAETEKRVLIHCAAGKDRTGVLVALILHSLGVPRDAIMADYLRSSKTPGLVAMKPRFMAHAKRRYGRDLSEDAVDMLLDVHPSYIESAFSSIEQRCGTIEAYLAESGIDAGVRGRLRERLLET